MEKDLLCGAGGPERLADAFAREAVCAFGDLLVGVYLHGSAAMGCFRPDVSDLDLIAVVSRPPGDAEKRAFMEAVVRLHEAGLKKGIEMSVVVRAVCDPFVYPTPYELHFSAMHLARWRADPDGYVRDMKGTDRDLAAHFAVIRERGRRLWGLPVKDVFGEVPRDLFLDSVWNDVAGAEREIQWNAAYLTLNLARALAYAQESLILSKREGGEWALEKIPDRFAPVVREALREYGGGEAARGGDAAKEYARYMLGRIRDGMDGAGTGVKGERA